MNSSVKAPAKYAYVDITGQRARGTGSSFGLVGALVAAGVAAGSEGPGRAQFDRVVAAEPVNVSALTREHVVKALQTSGMFQLAGGGADATLTLEITGYGVTPLNGEQLGAQIAARATLHDAARKQIWSKMGTGSSNVTAMLEDYVRNPRLWRQAIEEAAEKLARQLILYTDPETR